METRENNRTGKCSKCQGTGMERGVTPDDADQCPRCEGTGRTEADYWQAMHVHATFRTAQREHWCDLCGTVIDDGARYFDTGHSVSLRRVRMCVGCAGSPAPLPEFVDQDPDQADPFKGLMA